jgi:hypothetical protein
LFLGGFAMNTLFQNLTEPIIDIIKNYGSQGKKDQFDGRFKYNDYDFILTHLYVQMYGRESFSQAEESYNALPSKCRIFNMYKPSMFSIENRKDYKDMEGIFHKVLELVEKQNTTKFENDVIAIDSTVVSFGKWLNLGLHHKTDRSAVRISVAYSIETGIIKHVDISPAKTAEINCLDGFFDDKDAIYVFDRGYVNYNLFDHLTDLGIKFITRPKKNAILTKVNTTFFDNENTQVDSVFIGPTSSARFDKHLYQLVTSFEKDKICKLLTNIQNETASNLFSVYKKRWDIECFYKWIKQHLMVKHLFSYNLNGIKNQIYAALIVYCLVWLQRQSFILENNVSIKPPNQRHFMCNILNRIKDNLSFSISTKRLFKGLKFT